MEQYPSTTHGHGIIPVVQSHDHFTHTQKERNTNKHKTLVVGTDNRMVKQRGSTNNQSAVSFESLNR